MSGAKTSAWSDLRVKLIEFKKQYAALLEIMKKKEAVLVDGDSGKLAKLVKEEESFVNKLEKLENERVEAAAACMPEAQEVPTLKELLECAPEDEKEQLEKASVELLECMNDVSASNHGVAELVHESMDFVNYQLNLLGSDTSQDGIYGGDGSIKDDKPKIRGIINEEA